MVNMQIEILGVILIILLLGVVIWMQLKRPQHDSSEKLTQGLADTIEKMRDILDAKSAQDRLELQQRLDQVQTHVRHGMQSSQQAMSEQFNQAMKTVQEVTVKLATLENTNKQVLDFSSQLKSLQDILKNPKQRGVLGEYYLETLLKNVLGPESYTMQYRLGTDEAGKELIPDAVVFIKEKIIAIDSKFSLENYNRLVEEQNEAEKAKLEKLFVTDLKNRILETSKYIRPAQGTMDFAFMFIPHEAIYYDLLVNKIGAVNEENENLIQRAASKYRVIIVSPTSFLAYLQTVMQALRAMKIEETAQDIIKHVGELGKHFQKYSEYHAKIGKNLGTVVGQFNESSNELRKISKDVVRVTSGDASQLIEVDEVAKPVIE